MENNMIIVNLSQVKLPLYTENKYLDWVKYGEDNLYSRKLQDLMNRSALHNAIISSKVDNSCGQGLTYTKKKDSKTDNFIENPNPDETLDNIFHKLAYDYILYGGYYINVILSKDRKSIAELYHIPFDKIRLGKQDDRGNIVTFYYSKDWANYRKSENIPIIVPAYNKTSKEPSQIIYVKEYRPGCEYYPLPSYVGALSYIETGVEISNFHLSHIKNGMTPNVMISFNNGTPTDEERKVIERQISNKYVGTDNAGKFIITFSDDKDKAPLIQTLTPAQLDKQFLQLEATVLQNILSGHKIISPMLVGIKTEGQLGGATELDNAFTLYQNSVIKPIQDNILKTINKIGSVNGLQELYIEPVKPLEFSWSEDILKTIMTVTEMRDKINLPPVEIAEPVAPVAPENNIITNE